MLSLTFVEISISFIDWDRPVVPDSTCIPEASEGTSVRPGAGGAVILLLMPAAVVWLSGDRALLRWHWHLTMSV